MKSSIPPLPNYRTSVKYKNCVFTIRLEYHVGKYWHIHAECLSIVPNFGSWMYARRTQSSMLVIRSIMQQLSVYNEDQYNAFLRRPVELMRQKMESDPILGPDLRVWEAIG
jgi:hypothetical protein